MAPSSERKKNIKVVSGMTGNYKTHLQHASVVQIFRLIMQVICSFGGFATIRHNELRDFVESVVSEV